MKLSSFLGFIAVGTVMFFWPEWRSGTAFPGLKANDQDLWLRLMGLVQLLMGAGFFLGQSARQISHWLKQWPQELPGARVARGTMSLRPSVRRIVTERQA